MSVHDPQVDVERAREALLDPAMDHIVEMVLDRDPDVAEGSYRAASAAGAVRFHREADGTG